MRRSWNKTVQELLLTAECTIDFFEAAERWNLVYAPAIYQDATAERAAGELDFEAGKRPISPRCCSGRARRAAHRSQMRAHSLELRQLDFVMRSVPNLARPIAEAYRAILDAAETEPIAP